MLWPTDFHNLGKAMMAQSLFASNMLFMISDNYFDQPSRFSPLLHTWTLSVEEQFYVFFPLIVILCVWLAKRVMAGNKETGAISPRAEKMLLAAVVLIGVASLLLCVWLVDVRPGFSVTIWHNLTPISYATAGFYFLPSRAWELGLGAAIAILSLRIRSKLWAEVAAFVGTVSILGAFFLFNDATPFPGAAALLPVFGALCVITANEEHQTMIGKILSWRVLVFIGLISYSLYLWHWPVFVFASLVSPTPLSSVVMYALIVLIFCISYLSYRFVEIPLRSKKVIKTRGTAFALGFGSLLVLFLFGLLIFRGTLSNENRMPPAARTTLSILNAAAASQKEDDCFQLPGDGSQYGGLCRIGDRNSVANPPQFVLWGDSHAVALEHLFDSLGRQDDVQGVVFFNSSCIPVTGVWSVTASESCGPEQQYALQYIEDHNIKTIFLAARWNLYVTGGQDKARSALVTDSYTYAVSTEQAQHLFAEHLTEMLQQLTREGRQIYVMKQVPEQLDFDSRTAFYDAVHTGQVLQLKGVAASTSAIYLAPSNTVINSVTDISGVHLLDPSTILCAQSVYCELQSDGNLLYEDENHLNDVGAKLLGPLFAPIFLKISSR
jgi:peptidoglycan/LPS O-acetylase OafA/YrhL